MGHSFRLATAGKALKEADKALIMIHGRGGSAADTLDLAPFLQVDGYALLAPQATQNTWYPHSFMAPTEENEPWLTSALDMVQASVQTALDEGIQAENLYFFGFSQGACLVLEYLARHGQTYGGAVAIIGGLIGKEIDKSPYEGDFRKTPIYLGTSDPDFHVPVDRVRETEKILTDMNALVSLQVYENYPHSIHPDQITAANRIVFSQ